MANNIARYMSNYNRTILVLSAPFSSPSFIPQCNKIHSGLRSGLVVLGNGKGSVRSNQIYNNKEAGVYILFSGNPVVR